MACGKFIIVLGPTGSGKSTLMKHVIGTHAELVHPYSYTTRPRRPDAVENDHYRFVSVEEFRRDIEAGAFLEWAEYGGNYYGTKRDEVLTALQEGKVLLKEMEVQGARQARDLLAKDDLVSVFIDAGSWDELRDRVLARAPMSEEELHSRHSRYDDEVTFKAEADVVIENRAGRGEEAKAQFAALIEDALRAASKCI